MKQIQALKSTKKPWIVTGVLLSLALIGVGGCGSSTSTSAPAAPTTQSSTATPAASGTQSSAASQATQGQTDAKRALNPALKAALNISRLQRDQQNTLTSDQKTTLKPILQVLISTTTPSQDFLQQKADAINAVFTDQQKTFLATPRTPNGNKPNSNNSNGNSATGNRPKAGASNKQGGSAPNPQAMYQRVLDSLN